MNNKIEARTVLNGLHSNEDFDKIVFLNEKPSAVTEGLIRTNTDSVKESDKTNSDKPILSEPPNLYKQNGDSVENSGYFSFPRSISCDPRYKGARSKYQKVLHIILENAAFGKTTHSIGVEVIDIEVGQFCVSVRGLMDLCNEGVRYKEDFVDKNIVERASHFWRRCGFVRQEVRHGKILITVTVPEFYKKEKSTIETQTETKPRQNRDTKETYKTDKTVINSTMSSSQAQSTKVPERIFFDWQEMKLKGIEPSDIESWKSTFTHVDVPEYLKFIEQDMGAKPTKYKKKKQIIKTVLIYFQNRNENNARYQKTAKQPFQKPESLHNKSFTSDTSPKKYNNTYDFSKPQEVKK